MSTTKMNNQFFDHIFNKQQEAEDVPSNEDIAAWALRLICLLYPEKNKRFFSSAADIATEFDQLQNDLKVIMDATGACKDCDNDVRARKFFNHVPELYRVLNTDIDSILSGDPAATSRFEVIRAYPGFYAICFYRIAHALLRLEIPILPRILTEYAHSKTGIDIHPAAQIGEYLHIDHGTGIVIGETAVIGKYVKLYQGVTLGALSVDKAFAGIKRHPTVEDHVIIYSGATILGGETTIGEHSVIGGNVWLTRSVPARSTVYHEVGIKVIQREITDF